ncbi:MAG TPA: hypothetical protein PK573_13265, partial [Spirochaetota bacterium]|nr:hypothetical protein [Spirochaetota bacterium]
MIKRLSISASIILVLLCITGCDDSESGTGVENNPATATRVYGQGGSFTSGTANNGGISADSLSRPGCVVADSDGVYVADINNHRVLYFEGSSTTATRVYGQGGSFTSGTDNNGGI